MKTSKILAIIIAILMLTPTVVAIINYNMMQGGKAESYNTVSVTLIYPDGSSYVFDKNAKDTAMMDYFINTISNGSEVKNGIPDSVEQSENYQVVVKTTVNEFNYKFYYTQNVDACFFFDGGEAKAYKIAEADAETFLNCKYAAPLYENGTPPTLVLFGKELAPDAASWSFKNIADDYVKCDLSPIIKEETEVISLEGGLPMTFSLEPDIIEYTITNKKTGDVVHDLTSLNITENLDTSITAVAKWYEDENRTYYGEQTYKFDAVFGTPAKFHANITRNNEYGVGVCEIQVGEFITVTGLNVNDPSQITFQSTPDINYTPKFFSDAETGSAIALIPFSHNLPAGEYTLTFTYGGSTENINVTVKERGAYFSYHAFDEIEVEIDANIIASAGTDDARLKAEEALREVAKQESTSKRYWSNGETTYYGTEWFNDGSSLNYKTGYGHTIKVKDTNISFRNFGVDYQGKKGADVGANFAGKVIYAGRLDYCGYTVVIDHGYGLKSWYAHLGSISCAVDDEVEKGQAIGKIVAEGESSLSFTYMDGVHIGMTIYDIPVCSYGIWSDSGRPAEYLGITFYEEKEN